MIFISHNFNMHYIIIIIIVVLCLQQLLNKGVIGPIFYQDNVILCKRVSFSISVDRITTARTFNVINT